MLRWRAPEKRRSKLSSTASKFYFIHRKLRDFWLGEYLMTALIPSDTARLLSSPGTRSRILVWIFRDVNASCCFIVIDHQLLWHNLGIVSGEIGCIRAQARTPWSRSLASDERQFARRKTAKSVKGRFRTTATSCNTCLCGCPYYRNEHQHYQVYKMLHLNCQSS